MRVLKSAAIVAVVLAASGCATKVWDKPGATQSDFNSDSYNCEKDSRQSGYFGTGLAGALNMQAFFDKCMVAHGWEQHMQARSQASNIPLSESNPQGIGTKYAN